MKKKIGQLYQEEGGEFYPKTHTGAVLTPDGRTAEQRNSAQMSDIEGKLSGKGSSASAAQYPMLFLGNFNSLGEANAKLNQVYNSTDWKYQGRLRLSVNSVTLWVEQYAINVTQGMWMQVAYGPFAPSADGSALVAEQGKAHVSFRMYNGHVNRAWTDFATNGLSLKTINGQSIIGSGDIHIEGGGSAVTIDPSIDETSEHAVQNKAIAKAIADLNAAIEGITQAEGGVVMVDFWAGTQPSTANDGDMFYNTSARKLFKMEHGDWVEQTLAEDCMYVAKPSGTLYRWEGDAMTSLYLALENRLRSLELNAVTQGDVDSMIAEELDGRGVLDASKMKTIGGVSVVKSGSDTNIPMKTINGNELIGSGDITVEGGSGGCPIEPALWSSNYQDKDDWEVGDYWFNTAESNLYRCTDPQGEFEHVNKPCMLLFQDATYTYPYPGTIFRVADENNVSGNVAANGIEIAGKTVQMKTVNGQGIVGSGDIVIEGDGEVIPTNNPLYPEYYLTAEQKANIKYAPEYYKWPVVWFGGYVDNVTPVMNGNDFATYNGEVFAPSEWICNPHGLTIIDTNSVFFDTTRKIFVLKVGSVYYAAWNNSNQWMNNGVPKTETIFAKTEPLSDPVTPALPARPASFIWNGTELEKWYNADNVERMTNFTSAIDQCIVTNKGSMRLRKGKTYYCEISKDHAYGSQNQQWNGALIDGQGGRLLVRSTITHNTISEGNGFAFFYMKYCYHCTIKNLIVGSVRDNFLGGPSFTSEPCMSVAGSNVGFVHFRGSNRNIHIENIETYGMASDFSGTSNYSGQNGETYQKSLGITLKNWKAHLTNGNAIRGISGMTIDGYDVLFCGYSSGGCHGIYSQENTVGLEIRNSTFRNQDRYRQVMMAFYNGDPSVQDAATDTRAAFFIDCDFTGGKLFSLSSNAGHGGPLNTYSQHFRFVGCRFTQAFDTYATSAKKVETLDAMMSIINQHATFERCIFTSSVPAIYAGEDSNVGRGEEQKFVLKDCVFIRTIKEDRQENADLTTKPIVHFSGQYEMSNIETYQHNTGAKVQKWWDTLIGLESGTNVNLPETNYDKCQKLSNVLFGVDPSTLGDEPSPMRLNDVWYDAEEQVTKRCIKEGTHAWIEWQLCDFREDRVGRVYYGTTIMRFSENDIITVNHDNVGSRDALKAALTSALDTAGYVAVSNKGSVKRPGQYYISLVSTNTGWLYIIPKTTGRLEYYSDISLYRVMQDARYVKDGTETKDASPIWQILKTTSTKEASYNGTDPVIEIFDTSGVDKRTAKLEQSPGLALVPDFVQTTAPQSATAGQTWFDTANGAIKRYNGNTWVGADGEGVTRVVWANSKLYLCVASNVVKEIALNDLPNS